MCGMRMREADRVKAPILTSTGMWLPTGSHTALRKNGKDSRMLSATILISASR